MRGLCLLVSPFFSIVRVISLLVAAFPTALQGRQLRHVGSIVSFSSGASVPDISVYIILLYIVNLISE
jgi:hypothetical protein